MTIRRLLKDDKLAGQQEVERLAACRTEGSILVSAAATRGCNIDREKMRKRLLEPLANLQGALEKCLADLHEENEP